MAAKALHTCTVDRCDEKLQDPKTQLMNRNRKRAIDELITTEEKYINRLEILMSTYIEPLKNKDFLLSDEHHAKLFPAVLSSIIPLNKMLLSSLQSHRLNIGKEMLQFIPYFKMYQEYLNDYGSINNLMQELRKKKNSYFCQYLGSQEKKEGYTLESYLIEPIQRIPRYELLIKEILKLTRKQHDDYSDLETCFHKISSVNKEINKRITEYEQRHKVFLIEMKIMNLDINHTTSISSTNVFASWLSTSQSHNSRLNKFRLVSPSRRFIKEGYLTKVCRKKNIIYLFILFNDLLIYCSDAMGDEMILHEGINLCDAHFKLRKVKKENAFEIHSIEKSFIAYGATYKETGIWYDAIRQCLDDIRDSGNMRVLENEAVMKTSIDGDRNERIIKTAPLWSPKAQDTQCMMADCGQNIDTWFRGSYHCNYCGKIVCSDCLKNTLLHYDPHKRKENIKVGVCNECYRKYHKTVRRVSCNENDIKFDEHYLTESDEENEEDIAKGLLCFQKLMSMGFEEDIAFEASKQYADIKSALRYIKQSDALQEMEKKMDIHDVDALISSKYRSVEFDIFVAIDFGTHGTGLGFAVKQRKVKQWGATAAQHDEYEYITFLEEDWSGTPHGEIKNKTDILLTYDGKFIAFGYDALNKYKSVDEDMSEESDEEDEDEDGYNKRMAERDMLFESFKMSLYEKDGDNEGDIKDKIACKDGRLFCTEIVFVEALKFIKRSTFSAFKKKGLNITDSESDLQRIQWILTVPAIWSDVAKYKMEVWATKAGLIRGDIQSHLRIVYEPDCASISCQYELNGLMNDEKAIKRGERYILIDAGGGTVDIACHEVVEEDQMQEIYHPTGGPWGSDYIDVYFERFLGELFGDQVIKEYIHQYPHDFTKIIDNFRYAKMTFYCDQSKMYHATKLSSNFLFELEQDDILKLDMDNKWVQLENDTLFISKEIWSKQLFDVVMDPMIQHIADLLSHKVDDIAYICICGGLSSSPYFQSKMRDSFGMKSKYNLSIRIPPKPILSVIDGAVRLAMRPRYIVGRKMRMSYGIAVDRSLDEIDVDRLPSSYLETHTFTHCATNTRTVSGLFSAFIAKNDLMKMGEAIEKEYKRFDVKQRKKVIKIYCDSQRNPYIVSGKPLAEFAIYFKPNYDALRFKVRLYFGNTRIRVFAMNEELHLNYEFYDEMKYIELKKPPKPVIDGIEMMMNQDEMKMQINVICDRYDDIQYKAWFQVSMNDTDYEKKYDSLPIIVTDVSVGVEYYRIRVKCVNDQYETYSEAYIKDRFIFKVPPPTPRIKRKYAKDCMVYLQFECDANKDRFNEKYEIKMNNNKIETTTDRSIEMNALQNGEHYKFKIRAINTYGTSHWTSWIALKPLKKPYKPSDIHVVSGSSSIAVYWLSFDNMEEHYLCGEFRIISQPETTHKVVKNKHKVEFKAVCDGLKDGVYYRFKVIAVNDNFKIESDWTEAVKLDKKKEKQHYKKEKDVMKNTIYELHKTQFNKNNQFDECKEINIRDKRKANVKRISQKLIKQKTNHKSVPLPLSNFAHHNLYQNHHK